MLSKEEKEFRKELNRSIRLCKQRYGNNINGGTWGGIEESILKARREENVSNSSQH